MQEGAADIRALEGLLERWEHLAPRARTRADTVGDPGPLSELVRRGLAETRGASRLETASGREEIRAIAPSLHEGLLHFLEGDLGREADVRARIARLRVSFGGRTERMAAMASRSTSRNPDEREEAETALLGVLRDLGPELLAVARATAPRSTAPPVQVPEKMPKTRAGLVLPSAEMVAMLTSGIVGPRGAHGGVPVLAAPGVPGAARSDQGDAHEPGGDAITGWIDLAHALACSVTRAPLRAFHDWLAAAAARSIADFTLAPLSLRGWLLERATALPLGQPGVPLGRPDAAVEAGMDAWSATGHLLGAGACRGMPAIGAALAMTAATRAFLKRGLVENPSDPVSAARALMLALALRIVVASVGAQAGDAPEALHDGLLEALGAAPREARLAVIGAERGLARAPGEDGAIYDFGGGQLLLALRKGAALAWALRERFDEDWFRNARATPEAVSTLAGETLPAPWAEVLRWTAETAAL